MVVGGGRLSRRFQEAAHAVSRLADEDKDWLGIHATRLNAHLIRAIFRDVADPVIVDERKKLKRLRHPLTIASGWRPGWSTDYVAAAPPPGPGAPELLVAGKPSHVFDKDHALHADAKPLSALDWKTYRALIPKKWKPGLHTPVDPVAARLAAARKLTAIVVDGRNLKNFGRLLRDKEFAGTIVQ